MPRLPDQPVFLIQFDELVGRAAAIAFRFRLLHIRIVELPLQPTSGLGRPPFRRFDAHPPSAAASSHDAPDPSQRRSEEHTSELQSLMRISYAVFCLKKKKQKQNK